MYVLNIREMDAVNEFLKSIPDNSLCNWFFSMYILMVIFGSFQIIQIILQTISFMRLSFIKTSQKIVYLVGIIVALALLVMAIFNSLFLYSLCNRSLIRDKE
jgi:heme/copper-type cytochrome/quinol oxidase subunit 4